MLQFCSAALRPVDWIASTTQLLHEHNRQALRERSHEKTESARWPLIATQLQQLLPHGTLLAHTRAGNRVSQLTLCSHAIELTLGVRKWSG